MSNEKHLDDFEQLVLDYMDLLYTVAFKLTHSATDAQRLTQTTIVKALRLNNKLEVRKHIKPWLLTTMRNTFINDYSRKAGPLTLVELRRSESEEDSVHRWSF